MIYVLAGAIVMVSIIVGMFIGAFIVLSSNNVYIKSGKGKRK